MSSPFLIPENDRELNALRKTFRKEDQSLPLPVASSQGLPIQEWSSLSAVPTFAQLNASLRPPATTAQAAPPAWQPKREDMRSVLAQKRNILLVMMAVDTKRTEIAKLKQHTAQRGAALSKGEQMLSQDTAKFDAFLKDNDEKLRHAMQEAETEVKAKQEKVAEIKRLHAAAALLRSELSKLEEQLDECRSHRDFLMRITPPDFFTTEEAARTAAANARLAAWQSECDVIRQRRTDAREAETAARQAYDDARTQQEAEAAEAAIKAAVAALAAAQAAQEPPQPVEKPVDPDELPMFFQDPHQLLAIYAQLEQENLFLIQACQEAEEGLESAQTQLSGVQATLQRQTGGLTHQISSLQADLTNLQATPRQQKKGDDSPLTPIAHFGPEDEAAFDALAEKVAAVYEQCGFEKDPGLATVQMLGNMEARLEALTAASGDLSPEVMLTSQRLREKERRSVLREQKLQQQKQEHEDRVQRNLERSAAPSFQKKKTKPIMTRSMLPKKVLSLSNKSVDNADLELDRFLIRDFSQV